MNKRIIFLIFFLKIIMSSYGQDDSFKHFHYLFPSTYFYIQNTLALEMSINEKISVQIAYTNTYHHVFDCGRGYNVNNIIPEVRYYLYKNNRFIFIHYWIIRLLKILFVIVRVQVYTLVLIQINSGSVELGWA